MVQKRTLFDFVYRELVDQIEAGRIRYGEALPSAEKLSVLYGVGLRTVRDVLGVLRVKGYIRTQARRRAVVVYQERAQSADLRMLLRRREPVADCYGTLALIMPPLAVFSAGLGAREGAEALEDAFGLGEDWRIHTAFFERLLGRAANPLIDDLVSSLELYVHVPVLAGYRNPYVQAARINEESSAALSAALRRQDSEGVRCLVERIYRVIGRSVDEYLHSLPGEAPEGEEAPPWTWEARRGRLHLYEKLGQDLLRGIWEGTYRDGDFLPSSATLAERYSVSLFTVQQALGWLRSFGLARTFNGKGTQITLSGAHFAETGRRDALLYLHAIQLLQVLLPGAVRQACGGIEEEEIRRAADKLHSGGTVSVPLELLTPHLPFASMRRIFEQIQCLLLGGTMLLCVPPGEREKRLRELRRNYVYALEALQKGDSAGFAGILAEDCRILLREAKRTLLDANVYEAGFIVEV